MKYSPNKVKQICALIRKDTFTIAEICANVGISESCFYKWQENIPQFTEAIARARGEFDEILVKEAKNSLRKLVNGYDVEEKKTVYQNTTIKDENGKEKQVPKIKEQTTTVKHFQPNPHSVEFVLTNKVPDEYKNRMTNEVTGKDGKDLFAGKTDDELDARIRELEQKIAK